ncbi:hypothetical protein AAG747_00375 [Rapidithrix thailandica]|uniref:Phage protein n=1 Tax=Rapidithrix thailandica TaxID=413964 RepID=A0AAW9S097_9BACT
MKTVTIKDESLTGQLISEIEVALENERITVKELITARVYAEVEAYNQKLPEYFNGLVQPNDAEKTLNGYKLKQKRTIDPEKQVYIAWDAFQKNGYFVLVDDEQAESLEQEVLISDSTSISFVKLTPLVGG